MLWWFALLLILAGLEASTLENSELSIIVLKDSNHDSAIKTIEAMCSENKAAMRSLGISNECYLGPSACTHVYKNTVRGFAGRFTPRQIRSIKRCLPGAIHYHEGDATVAKMEDERHFSPAIVKKGNQNSQKSQDELYLRRQARRLRFNQQSSEPTVRPSTEFERDSAEDGGSINVWALSQGTPMDSPTPKLQKLNTRLWNLDRIDQVDLPLDGTYSYGQPGDPGLGEGVTIYIIDSGINLNHQEFWENPSGSTSSNTSQPSATQKRVSYGWNIIENNEIAFDADGHGSHVAGIAAGIQVGVAKGARISAVKILNEFGLGTVSDTVAALDWVATHATRPSVVTMSLGVAQGSYSRAMEASVKSLVVYHNITVVVASGNMAGDSCKMSPALTPEAITVAASDLPGKYTQMDLAASKSLPIGETVYVDGNQGACVDLFAPGVDIWSVCGGARRCGNVTSDSYAYASGTSMAVPHVAGAAAIYLSKNPNATPEDVRQALVGSASVDKIDPAVLKAGTPNRLLMTTLMSRKDTLPTEVQAAQGP